MYISEQVSYIFIIFVAPNTFVNNVITNDRISHFEEKAMSKTFMAIKTPTKNL